MGKVEKSSHISKFQLSSENLEDVQQNFRKSDLLWERGYKVDTEPKRHGWIGPSIHHVCGFSGGKYLKCVSVGSVVPAT